MSPGHGTASAPRATGQRLVACLTISALSDQMVSLHVGACLVNADDFGSSPTVNQAILGCFERGLITSATMIANLPGFAEAANMAREPRLQGRIGVHLNLTQGAPLTEPIRRFPRLCGVDGQLLPRSGTTWRLAPDESRAIETELAAQIEAVMAAGITPSHLDSHHHVHTQWAICTVVMRVARRYRIPGIRLSRNCGPGLGAVKRSYKAAFNARLARAGFARTTHFGSARDAEHLTGEVRALEIMTHPDLDTAGRVVDVTTGAGPLEDVARHWGATADLVSYSQLGGR